MRPTESIVLASSIVVLATAGHAADLRRSFDLPPTTLDRALEAFAAQSGLDVGLSGGGAASVPTPAVRGRLPPAEALRRLLGRTRWRAMPIAGGFRIVPKPVPPRTVPRQPHAPAAVAPGDAGVIVVLADRSRREIGGSVPDPTGTTGLLDPPRFAGGRGLSDALAGVPIVQSTALGAGREKLFIRGIADSSFLGPTQTTTGVYFGDVQLAAAGPDPNLKLYDVDRVEILEGPQGTLYGAGTIGGVIRIVPNAPGLDRVGASATLGITGTEGGAAGYDMAGVVNLPLRRDVAALRVVAYRDVSGGYVDDALRGLHDVNRTVGEGGRAALRVNPAAGWTIDLSGAVQEIRARDSQYATDGLPGLSRRSAIAQPFSSSLLLGRAVVTKRWESGLTLSLVAGAVRADARDRFDATPGPLSSIVAFDTRNQNDQHTEEVRLSRTWGSGGGSWLLGATFLNDHDRISRAIGPPGAPRSLGGVTNHARTKAIFGQATVPLLPAFRITAGLRLSEARIDSEPTISRPSPDFVRGREQTRLDPTLGTAWSLIRQLEWYTRLAKAFRTGGLSVAAGIGRVADFSSDSILVGETGLRWRRTGAYGFAGSLGYSRADWRNIQADLIDGRGFPYTANIGDNRIDSLEATMDWRGRGGTHLSGGLFYVASQGLDRDDARLRPRSTRLPDTPRVSASLGVTQGWTLAASSLEAGLFGRYVGRSYLDPAALLNISQGGFAYLDATAGWRRGPLTLALSLDNVTDARGDRFALGNPFGVARGNQYTPLRPRSIRLAVTVTR